MPKKGIISQATELLTGLAKLAFLAVGATLVWIDR